MRLQVDMGSRGIIIHDKKLFIQQWGDLYEITVKDKKLYFRDVILARKFRKWIRDREIGG